MNLIAPPSRSSPNATRMQPPISVATTRPSTPYFATVCRAAPRHDPDERTSRPADLHARAAKQRDEKAGDDRGVEAALGTQPTRDGERDRERQGDDADDDARDDVARELLAAVILERGDELRHEHGGGKILDSGIVVMNVASAAGMLALLQPQPLPAGIVVGLLDAIDKTFPLPFRPDGLVLDQDQEDLRQERRRSESNRRIEVLQTSALPLGYGAAEGSKVTKTRGFLNPGLREAQWSSPRLLTSGPTSTVR